MFRLRWSRRALDALTDHWLRADSATRRAITTAQHAVEQRLQRDPLHEGESRARGRRVTFVSPLTVYYRVEADGQTVSVLFVRVFRQGP